MSGDLVIEELGAQGDGMARTPSGPVYVPFTLPGERVTAAVQKNRADVIALRETSPLRVEPACRHFGACGGCALQHMQAEAYRDWKRDKIIRALQAHGMKADVASLVPCAPGSRRRVAFAVKRTQAGMLLGFNQALSHAIVSIGECPIAVAEIVAALDDLRRLMQIVCNTPMPFRATVTSTASGLDLAVEKAGRLADKRRRMASGAALEMGLARLSLDGEIIVEPKKPFVDFGGTTIELPPGGFLQAVAATEQAMADLVVSHLGRAKRNADLFAGSGAFALRLAKESEVHGVEGDAAAVAALDRGFRFSTGLKRVTAERRDLFRRPLTWKELDAYGGLVFDPPRAGAEDQARQIARSSVPRVAAVSCNPVTLARDLAILVEGGYTIERVVPLDQFLWSPHVEAVALLSKPKKAR